MRHRSVGLLSQVQHRPSTTAKAVIASANEPLTSAKDVFASAKEPWTITKAVIASANKPSTSAKPVMASVNKPWTTAKAVIASANEPSTTAKAVIAGATRVRHRSVGLFSQVRMSLRLAVSWEILPSSLAFLEWGTYIFNWTAVACRHLQTPTRLLPCVTTYFLALSLAPFALCQVQGNTRLYRFPFLSHSPCVWRSLLIHQLFPVMIETVEISPGLTGCCASARS